MVQIIQERRSPRTSEKFAAAFQQAAQQLPEMYEKYQAEQKQLRSQGLNREAVKSLTGLDLEDPEMQKIALQQGFQEKMKTTEAKTKAEETAKKLKQETQEKIVPLKGALESVAQMQRLRRKGNLGIGATYSPFSSTRKDAGEYATLGKSLIQYASSIPVRNQKEFETLSHDLIDPNITDAYAEGVLNKIEKIITDSLAAYDVEEDLEQDVKPKQIKRPLSVFRKKNG